MHVASRICIVRMCVLLKDREQSVEEDGTVTERKRKENKRGAASEPTIDSFTYSQYSTVTRSSAESEKLKETAQNKKRNREKTRRRSSADPHPTSRFDQMIVHENSWP
jgi:hypothetical protein